MIKLNWFKMLWLNSDERKILKRAKKEESSNESSNEVDIETTPYKNILFGDGSITVVFRNGDVISNHSVTYEIFLKVKQSKTKEEIEDLLIKANYSFEETGIETPEEREMVSSCLDIIKSNLDFNVTKNVIVKLRGVDLEMPAPVIASFIEVLERLELAEIEDDSNKCSELLTYYNALKMFWLKLAYNPLPQSRNDLLLFVRKNDVQITKTGNIILYRRILSVDGTDERLISFISTEYYRIKKEGFDPRNYAIGQKTSGDYYLADLVNTPYTKSELISNLQQSYLELPTMESNKYTAWHDRDVVIKVGGIYSIPDDNINLDNSICAAGGLHAACVNYDYSGFGNVPVVVLVNPSKAITVPLGETGKLRTTEMFIACINDKCHGEHYDQNALNIFDEEYHSMSITELEQAVKNKSFKRLSVKGNAPDINMNDLAVIKEMLKNRVKDIVF